MSLRGMLLLNRVAAVGAARIDGDLSRIGLSTAELTRLHVIGQSPEGISRHALAAEMVESASQAVRQTRPLEKLGWVERIADGGFALTHSGRSLLVEAVNIAEDTFARWLDESSVDDAAIAALLQPLAANSRHT